MSSALTVVPPGQGQLAYGDMLRPRSIGEAMDLAKMLAASDMVPKDYRGKPGNIIAAVQMGAELGLAPMQALQNIAVINGRPSVWGDALLALVQAHPDFEWIQERVEGDGDNKAAVCEVKRKGNPKPVVGRFSVADAKRANLWGKQGPWTQYPDRMLKMRARGFACRDAFADALRGLHSAEEVRDIPQEREVVMATGGEVTAETKPAPPAATLSVVLTNITNANTEEELLAVAGSASRLSLTDKAKAKMAYAKRQAAIRAQPKVAASVDAQEPLHLTGRVATDESEYDAETGEVKSDAASFADQDGLPPFDR